MEKRKAAVLIIFFFIATSMFFFSMSLKGQYNKARIEQKQNADSSIHYDADGEDDRIEILTKPGSRKRGQLNARKRDQLNTFELPRVEIGDLKQAPADAHMPGRPYKPNMTHLVDLPVEDAFRALVKEYLAPWLHPIDPDQKPGVPLTQRALATMEFSYKGGAFRVRIANKRLFYRKLVYWKQTYRSQRMLWYLHFLWDMLAKDGLLDGLPPIDFVIYVGDGPKVAADTFTTDAGFPLFSLRTSLTHIDIPVPDPVSFGSNGEYQWTETGKLVPWTERQDKLVFRGRGSCLKMQSDNWHVCNRVKAQKLSAENKNLLDIGVIEWNQLYQSRLSEEELKEAEIEMTTQLRKAAPMTFDEQSHYKYILDLDGGLGSSRKPGILSSGSVLFSQDSPWYCFYEPLMAAYRHYIPVDRWLRTLVDKVKWAIEHDDVMKQIQRAGAAFERKFMSLEASKAYMAILLREYARLFPSAPFTNPDDPVEVNYCERMRGSQGAAEIASGPMGCSGAWFEYTGEGSVPDYIVNDKAAFTRSKDPQPQQQLY